MARTHEHVLITTAPKSPLQEQREREHRYLLTMGLRLVCFIAAVVLFSVGLRWVAAFAVAGSLILPWVAVVAANAGPKRGEVEQPALYAGRTPTELDPSEPDPHEH